jgi:hypothetical protein
MTPSLLPARRRKYSAPPPSLPRQRPQGGHLRFIHVSPPDRPRAAFVTRLQPFQLPDRAARKTRPELDFGQFSKRRMREMCQNIGVHRIFSGSRARPGPCENSRRHQKYLQNGPFRAAKIGQSPAEWSLPPQVIRAFGEHGHEPTISQDGLCGLRRTC